MIGKNKKIIASVLAVAVLATAIPVTALAVETDAANSVSTTADSAATGSTTALSDLTMAQLLYIPEGATNSTWNIAYANKVAAMDEEAFANNFSKDDYKSFIEQAAALMPAYEKMIMDIFNDKTEVTGTLKDGVFTFTADVKDLNALVSDKINEQIEAAAGEYIEKIGKIDIQTKLDTTATITIDTTAVKETKKIKASFSMVNDDKTYKAYDIFAFAGDKLGDVQEEFNTFFTTKETEAKSELATAEGQIADAEAKIKEAKEVTVPTKEAELADAQKKLDDAEAQGADTTDEQAKLDDAKKQLEDAKAELADAEKQLNEATAKKNDANDKLKLAGEKAEEVSNVFGRYINKMNSMKTSFDNALALTSTANGANADEAYDKFYNAIMSKNIPQAVKNRIPATLDAFLNSKAFATSMDFMKNISPADVEAVLDTATNVKIALENGKFSVVGDIVDAGVNKKVTIEADASAIKNDSAVTLFFDVERLDEETTTTTTTDVSGDETTTTDVSGDETTTTDVSGDETTTTDVSGEVTTTPVSSEDIPGTTTTAGNGKSLWDLAMEDESGRYKAAVLGDISLDYDVKTGTPSITEAIDSYDALLALQNSIGAIDLAAVPTIVADVNFDGEITSYDALGILQFAVGSVDEYKDTSTGESALYVAVEFDEGLDTILRREYYTKDMAKSPISNTYKRFSFDK